MTAPVGRLLKASLLFGFILGSCAAGLYFGVNSEGFRHWLEDDLSTRTGYSIHTAKLSLTLPLRLVASAVTAAKDGHEVLTVSRLTVTVTPIDIVAKTIQRIDLEQPVLKIPLAELLKSREKKATTLALRHLSITNGRALISTEDGAQWDIPAINLDARNINLGGETGIALQADVPLLDGVAEIAIKRQTERIVLSATINRKQSKGLFRRESAEAKPILKIDAALNTPVAQLPTANIELHFNQLKLGQKELAGSLQAKVDLEKTFSAGSFTSQLGLDDFPNSVSPVALPTTNALALVNASGDFSVANKTVTIKALTLRSHLGNAQGAGRLAFTATASITDGQIVAGNLEWESVKKFLPAPFSQWHYQGQAELDIKLRGPWRALEIDGSARSTAAQVRGGNFSLASFSVSAPFHWSNGQLAAQNGRFEGKKFTFEGSNKSKSAIAQIDLGAITYDPKKPRTVTAQVKLSGGQFSSADSSKVGESLAMDGSVEVTAKGENQTTAIAAKLDVSAGELLWGKFFGDLKSQKPALVIDAEYSQALDRLQCRRCDLALATVGQLRLTGSVEQVSATPWLRLQARGDNLAPAGFFEFFLRETFNRQYPVLDQLVIGGQIDVQMELAGAIDALSASGNLTLKNGAIATKARDWQIGALSLTLPFQIGLGAKTSQAGAAPAPGTLSIDRASFANQRLAPISTTVSLVKNALRLHQPLRFTVFGGELELRNLTWPDIVNDPKALSFAAETKRLQLQQLTEAFNWPRFSGQLNGAIGEIESAGNTLRSRGEFQADLFGGRVRISKLEIDNPFSALASVKLSARVESIELEQLTKTFAFGRISGILEGSVDELVITDGQPSELRADLHSVERSGVDQRISVDALNKITVLSSGQEAGALYGGLAGFFDNFRYSKLGFKATLRNDRLTLHGVESQGDKELLVVGSFLPPTVNIVSHTQTIAFSELLRRFERIKSDKPQVK